MGHTGSWSTRFLTQARDKFMDEANEKITGWSNGQVRSLSLSHIGDYYGRYRLSDSETARLMKRSLKRYGQISPVVICDRAGSLELVDGFKRLSAAREVGGMVTLTARFLDLDESHAKAAIYGLNRVAGKVHELEEAWLVYALETDFPKYYIFGQSRYDQCTWKRVIKSADLANQSAFQLVLAGVDVYSKINYS